MEPRLAMNDPPASAFGMQGLQACKTTFQPFISCLQPCLLSERRGILNVEDQETWGEKPVATEKRERAAAAYCRQHNLQSSAEARSLALSVGTSDGRQNPEQAPHCCIMGCGLRRPLTSSSL